MNKTQPQSLAPTLWQISALVALAVLAVVAIMTVLNAQASSTDPQQAKAIATNVASWDQSGAK